MFAITVLLKFMGYSVSNIWRNEPFDCVCVIDFLFSQTSTRKHIASILKLHDSGKRLDYFLVFSNLLLTDSNLLIQLIPYLHTDSSETFVRERYIYIYINHLPYINLKIYLRWGRSSFPFTVPLMSTFPRVNIHHFQPSFSEGLYIWSFYANDVIWQWISGKGTVSSGWKNWCIESWDVASTLKGGDLTADLLMDVLCTFLSTMPWPFFCRVSPSKGIAFFRQLSLHSSRCNCFLIYSCLLVYKSPLH